MLSKCRGIYKSSIFDQFTPNFAHELFGIPVEGRKSIRLEATVRNSFILYVYIGTFI